MRGYVRKLEHEHFLEIDNTAPYIKPIDGDDEDDEDEGAADRQQIRESRDEDGGVW